MQGEYERRMAAMGAEAEQASEALRGRVERLQSERAAADRARAAAEARLLEVEESLRREASAERMVRSTALLLCWGLSWAHQVRVACDGRMQGFVNIAMLLSRSPTLSPSSC